jgi:tRNA pseudouridine32 synthase/23S rRNA pseudouridine746 synthase
MPSFTSALPMAACSPRPSRPPRRPSGPALTGRAARRERAAQPPPRQPPGGGPATLYLGEAGHSAARPRVLDTPAGLACLYEDASVLAFDKPAGMHSVPGKGEDKQDCLSARVQSIYPEARVVHRLDLDTSGLIVMARGAEPSASTAACQRQVDKRYVAVVQGCGAALWA